MHRAMRDHRAQRRPPVGWQIGGYLDGQADAAHPRRAVTGHVETSRHGQSVPAVPVTRQVPACIESHARGQGRDKQLDGVGAVSRPPASAGWSTSTRCPRTDTSYDSPAT